MSCRSTSIALPASTGVTVSCSPRSFASIAAATSTSSMNWASGTCSRRWSPASSRRGQRPVDQVAQGDQVASEDHARRRRRADHPALRLEGEPRVGQQASRSSLARRSPGARSLGPRATAPSGGRTPRHRLRDGLVQAPVERPELGGRDRDLPLDGQLRHGLAHVPVIVDDLRRDGEPAPARCGAEGVSRWSGTPGSPARTPAALAELREEQRHSSAPLPWAAGRCGSATFARVRAMISSRRSGQEFMEQSDLPGKTHEPGACAARSNASASR